MAFPHPSPHQQLITSSPYLISSFQCHNISADFFLLSPIWFLVLLCLIWELLALCCLCTTQVVPREKGGLHLCFLPCTKAGCARGHSCCCCSNNPSLLGGEIYLLRWNKESI